MDNYLSIYDFEKRSGFLQNGTLNSPLRLNRIIPLKSARFRKRNFKGSLEETQKLFSIISIDDFKALCEKKRVGGMEEFLEENGITYESFCW